MSLSSKFAEMKAKITASLMGDALRAKAMRGGVWLGSGSVAEQTARFVRNMILTRLLAPGAFGAMALVSSSSAIVGSLTEIGQRQAVIQNPRGGEKEYLEAGWWLGFLRSFGTYLIIFAMAPFVAHFYGMEELSPLLRVALLGALFDGAMSPRSALAQREMRFGRWAIISNGGAICGVVLTVVLSFILRDVWALAIGLASEYAFRCLFSYILYPGLPSLRWDPSARRELYSYSKQAMGLSFMNLIFSRTDIFVLGKLYSPTQLGVYSMGVALIGTPATFVINMLAQALFPAFAKVQHEKERINKILIEVTSWLILIGLPGAVVVYLCGSTLLSTAYGRRYVGAAAPLAVAGIVVLLNTLNACITCVFSALGRPGLHRRAVAASAVIMIIVSYPCCKALGIVGGQVAALMAIIVSYGLQVARMRDLTGLNLLRYARPVVPAALAAAGIFLVGYGIRLLGLAVNPAIDISLVMAACLIAYGLSVPAFMRANRST
jgi:O-antigen/teichoic acid export membrane protein